MFICSRRVFRGISKDKGISLIAVVIVMLIVAALGLLLSSMISTGNISSLTDLQSYQAFYIAQAGMEWYMEQLQNDSDWSTPPTVKTDQAFGAGTFSVTYANAATDSIDITGTGKVMGFDGNSVQRVISMHVEKTSGGTTIETSLWKESL